LIGRRLLLLSAATACGLRGGHAIPPVPHLDRLAFRIVRNGSAIGTHVLNFVLVDNGLDIHIAVDIAVRFGPLVLFHYTLRGLEQWRGDVVVHVDATTNDDGTIDDMRADRDARDLWVQGRRRRATWRRPMHCRQRTGTCGRWMGPGSTRRTGGCSIPLCSASGGIRCRWGMAAWNRRRTSSCPAMCTWNFGTTQRVDGPHCYSPPGTARRSATN
jgi:hypothetical protein